MPPQIDFTLDRIQSIEELLSGMKARLAHVETNIVSEIGQEGVELARIGLGGIDFGDDDDGDENIQSGDSGNRADPNPGSASSDVIQDRSGTKSPPKSAQTKPGTSIDQVVPAIMIAHVPSATAKPGAASALGYS